MQQVIIEFAGDRGCGKTTLASILSEELRGPGVLFIDAASDLRLTQMLAPEPPSLTLAGLIQQKPANPEAIDWVFHDLTVAIGEEMELMAVAIGEEMELMAVGHLPERLDEADWKRLKYGFPRFIKEYETVIVDGQHPILAHLLPEDALRPVWVLCPGGGLGPEEPALNAHTPYVVLNQAGEDAPIPEELAARLQSGDLRLIGKLPRYATSEDRIRKLPEDFRNCLMRMNIPLRFAQT